VAARVRGISKAAAGELPECCRIPGETATLNLAHSLKGAIRETLAKGEGGMNVLTVYAHHNPKSFCHAVLERFSARLADAGHSNEIVDLLFDPPLSRKEKPPHMSWQAESR
jgi:hypothetical protein